MFRFLVSRGDFRTALVRLLPHAGTKDKEGTAPFGRVRFSLDPDDQVVIWTGDQLTRAVAVVPAAIQAEQIGTFDLAVEEIATFLAALKPTGSAEKKSAWYSGDFMITVSQDKVTIAEHWEIHPVTKEISLPRIQYTEDPYPDIPAIIVSALSAQQVPVDYISAKQEVFARVSRSQYDTMQIIGIDRQAIVIGGSTEFTALIPCAVGHGIAHPVRDDVDWTDLINILRGHVRRPSLPTDKDSEAIKHRFGWEHGFELAIKPGEKS